MKYSNIQQNVGNSEILTNFTNFWSRKGFSD